MGDDAAGAELEFSAGHPDCPISFHCGAITGPRLRACILMMGARSPDDALAGLQKGRPFVIGSASAEADEA